MVRHDIAVIRELRTADAALTALGNDFSVEQLSHLSIGSEFAIPSRMKWIFNTTDAKLSHCLRFLNYLSSATGKGTMDRADLVAAKSHDFPPDHD
jgi:hypothetical protein